MTSQLLLALSILGFGVTYASKAPGSSWYQDTQRPLRQEKLRRQALYQDPVKRHREEKLRRQAQYKDLLQSHRSRTNTLKATGVAPLSSFSKGSVSEVELLSPHNQACLKTLRCAIQEYVWEGNLASLETIKGVMNDNSQSFSWLGAMFARTIAPDHEDDGVVIHRQWRSLYQFIEDGCRRINDVEIFNRMVELQALLNSWLTEKMTFSKFPGSTEIKLYHAINTYALYGTTGILGLEGFKACLAANADVQTPYVWTQVQDYVDMCGLPQVQDLRLSILDYTKRQRVESEKYNTLLDIQARQREIQGLFDEHLAQNKAL